ncbi:MAG: hypothetical protein J0J01_04825 [Reyranella sp.]|uniref:hypothetical protein n=1 Tax=Reyranella sp. TaxID=1929291 RepID=UPI001AD14304|nr:hypothetical protein [Reyranella sp.]MBN9086214.1 hypothetical protein [Reyranella sp.]
MRLSVGEILSESFGFFFARLGLFFHLVTIPWILSLLLRIAVWSVIEPTLMSGLVEKALDAIPATMFVVAWIRVVLLGPERVDRLPGLGWSTRETAFVGHLLQVAGITFVLLAAMLLVIGPIDPMTLGRGATDPEAARREAMATPLGAGFIASFLLALRVSFGLAASAVDLPWSPRRSWAYGRGNSWPIIGSLFLILLVSSVANGLAIAMSLALTHRLGAESAIMIVTWTVSTLVSYGGTALLTTALAVIFRRLTKWREGVPLA